MVHDSPPHQDQHDPIAEFFSSLLIADFFNGIDPRRTNGDMVPASY